MFAGRKFRDFEGFFQKIAKTNSTKWQVFFVNREKILKNMNFCHKTLHDLKVK